MQEERLTLAIRKRISEGRERSKTLCRRAFPVDLEGVESKIFRVSVVGRIPKCFPKIFLTPSNVNTMS